MQLLVNFLRLKISKSGFCSSLCLVKIFNLFLSHSCFLFPFINTPVGVIYPVCLADISNKLALHIKSSAPSNVDGILKFRGLPAVYSFVLFCCIKQLSTETMLLNNPSKGIDAAFQLFTFFKKNTVLRGYKMSLKKSNTCK